MNLLSNIFKINNYINKYKIFKIKYYKDNKKIKEKIKIIK